MTKLAIFDPRNFVTKTTNFVSKSRVLLIKLILRLSVGQAIGNDRVAKKALIELARYFPITRNQRSFAETRKAVSIRQKNRKRITLMAVREFLLDRVVTEGRMRTGVSMDWFGTCVQRCVFILFCVEVYLFGFLFAQCF